jgi:trk system potassium uptake protein TrkH
MQLARHIAPLDLRAVLTHLAPVLRLLGAVLTVPLLVALIARELEQSAIFGGLALAVWLCGWAGARGQRPDLDLREALVVTALSYLVFGLVSALVFLPAAPFIDGFFEAMSGFTTTGLSVLDVERLPKSLLFFRAYTQWVGGAGIIVLSLVILLGPRKASLQLYASESSAENLVGSVLVTTRIVTKIYLLLTVLGFIVFVAAGMDFFDAILHVMATLSTGGFSPYTRSIGHYDGAGHGAVRLAVTLFMFLGAVSFPLYYYARVEGPRRFFQDLQVRYLIAIAATAALLLCGFSDWSTDRFLNSLFEAMSALTTTGFGLDEADSVSSQRKFVSILLMTVGGTTGSTAGGIKLFRFIVMLKLVAWLNARTLLPQEAKMAITYEGLAISDSEIRQICGFVVLYLALVCLSALVFVFSGFAIPDAIFESASALGTVGLSTGLTSPGLPFGLKLLLIFDMWAGRLEILAVLIVLNPVLWIRRRRSV